MSDDNTEETFEMEVTPAFRRFLPELRASTERLARSVQASVRMVLDATGVREQFRRVQRAIDRESRANPLTLPAPLESSPSNSPPAGRQRDERGRFIRGSGTAQVDVDAQTMGASAHIARFIAKKRKLLIDAELDKKSLAGIGTALAAMSGARVASDGVKKLGTELGQLDRSTPKIAAVATGIGGILAASLGAVGGSASLIASLASLAGIAGLIPGAMGAMAASLGVGIAALSGMGDAIGSIKKNAEAAAAPKADPLIEQMRKQQELNAVTDAQVSKNEAIADGEKSVARARADVTAAIDEETRAVARLNRSLAVAEADTENALAAMEKAATALKQSEGDNGFSDSEKADLRRKAKETKALYEQQKGNTADLKKQSDEAARTGVEDSERVMSAKEKLLDAEEQASRSLTAANKSLNDANVSLLISEMARADAQRIAAAEADDAMRRISPSAQVAAVAIGAVLGRLKEVQQVAQEAFFAGFAAPFLNLADVVIPQLKVGVAGLAASMGDGVQKFMNSLSGNLDGGVLERMFGTTTQANDILNGAIEPLTRAFVKIGDVGVTFLPQLAQGFSDISNQFGSFIDRVAADGSLAAWIQGGLDTAQALGDVLSGSFGILGAIATAAQDAGGSTIQDLGNGLKEVAAIMQKEPFQSALRVIFEGAGGALDNMGKSLKPIGDMFLQLAPTLNKVLPIIGSILGEGLGGIAELLGDPVLQQGLQTMFKGILDGVEGLRPAMGPLGQLLGNVAEVVGKLASTLGPVIGEIISQLVPVVGVLLDATLPLIDALSEMLVAVLPVLMPVIQAAAGILMALIAMTTGAVQILTTLFSPGFWESAGSMWHEFWKGINVGITNFVRDTGGMLTDFGANTIGMFVDFFSNSVGMFVDWGRNVGDEVGKIVGSIGDWFTSLPETIGNILKDAGTWFLDVGVDIVQGILDGITSMAGKIGKFFLDVLPGWMVEPFKVALDIHSPSRVFGKLGANVAQGVVVGAESERANVEKTMRTLITIPKVNASELAKSARSTSLALAKSVRASGTKFDPLALTAARAAAVVPSKGDTINLFENVSARHTLVQATRLKKRQR